MNCAIFIWCACSFSEISHCEFISRWLQQYDAIQSVGTTINAQHRDHTRSIECSRMWSSGDILDTSPGFISRMDYGLTNVVVRGHPGDIPGFPVEIWILGHNGCCVPYVSSKFRTLNAESIRVLAAWTLRVTGKYEQYSTSNLEILAECCEYVRVWVALKIQMPRVQGVPADRMPKYPNGRSSVLSL